MKTVKRLPEGKSITNEMRRPSDLKPWPTNSRDHPPSQVTFLASAIARFGFTNPVLVDESDFILAGHGRVKAALELKLGEIPTRKLYGLSDSEKRTYRVSDNKSGMQSNWNVENLKSELEIIGLDTSIGIELTGFTTAEVDVMFEEPDLGDEDEILETDLLEAPVSRLGDLWHAGDHKLQCGSALASSDYESLMGSDIAQLCVTDPPYNVRIDGVSGSGKVKHREFAMASGEMSPVAYIGFLTEAFGHMHRHVSDGAVTYAFIDWRHTQEMLAGVSSHFGAPLQMCVWAKDNAGMGTFYRSQHELVFVFKKGEAPHINNFELGQHGRYRTNVWNYPGINSGKGRKLMKLHPTVKPVSLIADAIRDCSHRRGIVLDPFAGSGTILIAAERTGRFARAIELDPLYVDVGITRWQRLTGKQAVLAATGQTWAEVQAQRCPLVREDFDD